MLFCNAAVMNRSRSYGTAVRVYLQLVFGAGLLIFSTCRYLSGAVMKSVTYAAAGEAAFWSVRGVHFVSANLLWPFIFKYCNYRWVLSRFDVVVAIFGTKVRRSYSRIKETRSGC